MGCPGDAQVPAAIRPDAFTTGNPLARILAEPTSTRYAAAGRMYGMYVCVGFVARS